LTASEVAFLALGLVLGLASGAALIEVLRAKPPASREVRVTVAPNAIHARFASTLADPTASNEASGPARGGPADRRWHDDPPDDEAATPARALVDPAANPTGAVASTGRGVAGSAPATGSSVPSAVGAQPRREPLWLAPTPGGATSMVAVPMALEPDPMTAALRSTAAASATVAMARNEVAAASSVRGRGAADAGAAPDNLASATAPSSDTATATETRPVDAGTNTGPCADERRIADERCTVATRAREGAVRAAEALRAAQRAYDQEAAAAEAGAAATDPRAVRAAKEAAQQQFRDARARAQTRDDVEGAARDWLAEINRINQATRDAAAGVDRRRNAAAALALSLERLAVEADAARISAERADEACIAAREAVAACDEARALEAAAARAATSSPAEQVGTRRQRQPAAAPATVPSDERSPLEEAGSQAGQDALLLRILRGDRDAMQRAVARLTAEEPNGASRWQVLISGLADALVARSIEASAFDFPIDHFFWGGFSQAQNRDIASGLASMGFRFDGFGGWLDDRVPSQRDLSLATGYAGLDPMRIRHWPNEPEMQALLSEVRVAADEYVAAAASGLTLGELITLLGRRADALTELWNSWGIVRPVLLEGR
jgi:hypothetical protein